MKIFNSIKSLFKKGLFHIMGSTVINKAIAFITNIFLVRIFTDFDYGVFSGAFNVFLIVSLLTGFGINSATLYYASEKEDEDTRKSVYLFSLRYGLIISLFLCLIILLYGLYGHVVIKKLFEFVGLEYVGIPETRPYIIGLAGLPIFSFLVDHFAIVLRTRKENKKYALLLNINSGTYAVFAVLGSLLFGITGTIVGRYLSYLATAVLGILFTRKYTSFRRFIGLGTQKSKKIIKYAAFSGFVSALNNILYRIDITLVKLLIGDAAILASYKVSAIIPENMNFIPQSILIVFLPLFIENQGNRQWVASKAKELFKNMTIVCGAISIFMIIFAELIVRILWGVKYIDCVPYFRILAISFFFLGVFRSTSTNILQAMGRVKFNLVVSIVASAANIYLDIVLIKQWGALGAALATLLVTIIASAMSFPYLVYVLRKQKQPDIDIYEN